MTETASAANAAMAPVAAQNVPELYRGPLASIDVSNLLPYLNSDQHVSKVKRNKGRRAEHTAHAR